MWCGAFVPGPTEFVPKLGERVHSRRMWVPLRWEYPSSCFPGSSFRDFVFIHLYSYLVHWSNSTCAYFSDGWRKTSARWRKWWYTCLGYSPKGSHVFPLKDEICKVEGFLGKSLKFMEELDGNTNPNILTCKTQKVCWYICLKLIEYA